MSKTVSEIYKEYKIMPSLGEHMLRVASVASLICDNLTEKINKEDLVLACLFHDMGNIIKSDLILFPEFLEPEGIEYWQMVKKDYLRKYGNNEVEATKQIMEEIGLPASSIKIAGQNKFSFVCVHAESNDVAMKVVQYSDYRVAPRGVVSYLDRMEEAKHRYKEQDKGREKEREKLVACGAEIEKQIFAKCKIKPEDITDETVAPIIASLRDSVIK